MTDKDFFLHTYKEAVTHIEHEIAQSNTYLTQTFPMHDPFYQELARFTANGGKRFRPALSLVVARSFGQNKVTPHIALETFHKYLLVHDDIIDQDTMRYGAPTVHAKMSERHTDAASSKHFGTSLGIIGGDLLAAATHKIILKADLSADIKIALDTLIVQAVEDVSWGWYDQFLMDYLPLNSTELNFERIETSIIWVTGKYSIKLPLLFGYAMAEHTPPEELSLFADTLGALYQTGDDVIGLFGSEKETGKSNYGDIIQGKKTIPMWFTYASATAVDKATLVSIVGKKDASASEIDEVRAIIKRSGGLAQTETLMHEYRQRCLGLLEEIDMTSDLKCFFKGFIEFIEKRDY